MDRFGPEIITLENGDTELLPRQSRCNLIHTCTKKILVKRDSSCLYNVIPYILYKYHSEAESIQKVKKYIWKKYLNTTDPYIFIDNYGCSDNVLRNSIVETLDMHIPNSNDLVTFITQVRNAMFEKIIFSCPSHMISAANKINDGILKINTITGYVSLNNYKEIDKI